MVTPQDLEQKVLFSQSIIETQQENARMQLMNAIDVQCKDVTDNSKNLIQARVSKK